MQYTSNAHLFEAQGKYPKIWLEVKESEAQQIKKRPMRCAVETLERLQYSWVLLGKRWGRHTDYPVAMTWTKAANSQVTAVSKWTDISLRMQSDMGIHEDFVKIFNEVWAQYFGDIREYPWKTSHHMEEFDTDTVDDAIPRHMKFNWRPEMYTRSGTPRTHAEDDDGNGKAKGKGRGKGKGKSKSSGKDSY